MITGKRSPDEEKAFNRAKAAAFQGVSPKRERFVDPYTGATYYVAPIPADVCQECGGHRVVYDVDAGLLPCPACATDVCPVCGDLGVVAPERSIDDPDHGRLVLCPRQCKAARQLQQDRTAKLYAGAKLPQTYQDCTLASFRELVRRDDAARLWDGKMLAYYAVEAFIAAADRGYYVDYADVVAKARGATLGDVLPDERNWLVLFGERGVGKTGFMAAVVNALVPQNHVIRYIRTQDFVKAVHDRYGDDWRDNPPDDEFGAMDSGAVLDTVRKAPLLILDEFDMPDGGTPSKQALMESVIRHRHGHMLPTLITTNLDEDGLERRWGATTVTVIRQRAHFVPVGGPALRPTPQMISEVL